VVPATTVVVAVMVLSACTSGRHHVATQSQPSGSATPSVATTSDAGSPTSPPASGPARALTATTVGARLPQPLSRVVAVDLDDKVQIIGGLTASGQTSAGIEIFDPSTGGVTTAGKLAAPVHDAAAGVINGAAIVAGGGAATTTNAVQQVQANGTAVRVGQLPQARSDDSVAVSGKTLYVVGGYDGAHEVPGVLATTDGVNFTQVGQLVETIRYGAAYAADGSIWVFGGEHHGVATSDIQRVDAATGKSSVVAKFPHPLAHETVATLGDQVLVIGGTDGHSPQNTVYKFDPSTVAVSVVGSLPESVSDMACVAVRDTVYVIGGNALTEQRTVAATTAIVALKMQAVSPNANAEGPPDDSRPERPGTG
jgi:N-acetylneuraminic acid mutarotase